MFFLVFMNYLKICVTRRERSDRHKKRKKTIFGIFENEYYTVQATGQTLEEKENYFWFF